MIWGPKQAAHAKALARNLQKEIANYLREFDELSEGKPDRELVVTAALCHAIGYADGAKACDVRSILELLRAKVES